MPGSPCLLHPSAVPSLACPGCRAPLCALCPPGSCPTCSLELGVGLACRTCACLVAAVESLDARGTCVGCWEKRAASFVRSREPGHPGGGPFARMLCLTLAGLVRQAELRRRTELWLVHDQALAAATDGCSVFELGLLLGLEGDALLAAVQANLDRATLELVPELVGSGMAPLLAVTDLAPALGGDRPAASVPLPSPFKAAPPVHFSYPARPPVSPFEAGPGRDFRSRRRRG